MKAHYKEIRKFAGRDREIYLHGSRSKTKITSPETDWDYAVDYLYLEDIEKAFRLGWKEIVDQSYCDSNTSFVFEKMINGDKVQVSSRHSLETFKKAWESISVEDYVNLYWKDKPALRNRLESEYYKTNNDWSEEIPF